MIWGDSMKKLIIIITVLIIGVSGCSDINDEPVIRYQEIDLVNELIESLPEEITENDRQLIILARDQYNLLTDDEKTLVTNIEILDNAEALIASIDAEKQAEEEKNKQILNKLKMLETEIVSNLPKIIFDNIVLPLEKNLDDKKVTILWHTSDPNTISTLGVVIPGRSDIVVELTATLILDDVRHSFKQNIVVKAIELEPLPLNDLVFAYAYNTRIGFDDIAIETIDVINHAFSSVVNGVVSVGASNRLQLLELRKQGVRVNLCIGGYGNAAIPISKAARTEAGRVKLAKSIVDAIERYHFDGVDIDWEYPGFYTDPNYIISQEEDTRNYTLFIKELRRQVKDANSDYLVTAAVPGGPWSPTRYNISDISNCLDYLLLMTYDLQVGTSFLHTALYPSANTFEGCTVSETVEYYKSRGASANKLVIGAAFYGRVNNDSIIYDEIRKKMDSSNVTKHWDDVAKAPYLYDSINNQKISYDDSKSIKNKIQYLKSEGLAGIMFWEFNQDSSGELIRAINTNMK